MGAEGCADPLRCFSFQDEASMSMASGALLGCIPYRLSLPTANPRGPASGTLSDPLGPSFSAGLCSAGLEVEESWSLVTSCLFTRVCAQEP